MSGKLSPRALWGRCRTARVGAIDEQDQGCEQADRSCAYENARLPEHTRGNRDDAGEPQRRHQAGALIRTRLRQHPALASAQQGRRQKTDQNQISDQPDPMVEANGGPDHRRDQPSYTAKARNHDQRVDRGATGGLSAGHGCCWSGPRRGHRYRPR